MIPCHDCQVRADAHQEDGNCPFANGTIECLGRRVDNIEKMLRAIKRALDGE